LGKMRGEQDLVDTLVSFRNETQGTMGGITAALNKEIPLQERLYSLLGSINFWRESERNLNATIAEEAWRIEYKLTLVVEGQLQRITVNYYIIIEENTHDYPRDPNRSYRRKGGARYRNRVHYPKGAFQAYLECDAFVEGGTPKEDKEPFKSLDAVMREDVAGEFMDEFKNPTIDGATNYRQNDLELDPRGRDFTMGIVSIRPKGEEIGKPPFKLYIERMSEGKGGWNIAVEEYLMSIEEYDRFTANMTEYRAALRRIG